jgi:hypothetical protein
MSVCPCCGTGIKPARGWTWVNPSLLVPQRVHGSEMHNLVCPFGVTVEHPEHAMGERAGLLWIGRQFYTPQEFMAEAAQMGVSRRITQVPRDFKVGETWVLLGHRDAVHKGYQEKNGDRFFDDTVGLMESGLKLDEWEDVFAPGILTAFKPTAVEYVVRPEEEHDEEFLARLVKRGIEPVKVVKAQAEIEVSS